MNAPVLDLAAARRRKLATAAYDARLFGATDRQVARCGDDLAELVLLKQRLVRRTMRAPAPA